MTTFFTHSSPFPSIVMAPYIYLRARIPLFTSLGSLYLCSLVYNFSDFVIPKSFHFSFTFPIESPGKVCISTPMLWGPVISFVPLLTWVLAFYAAIFHWETLTTSLSSNFLSHIPFRWLEVMKRLALKSLSPCPVPSFLKQCLSMLCLAFTNVFMCLSALWGTLFHSIEDAGLSSALYRLWSPKCFKCRSIHQSVLLFV